MHDRIWNKCVRERHTQLWFTVDALITEQNYVLMFEKSFGCFFVYINDGTGHAIRYDSLDKFTLFNN